MPKKSMSLPRALRLLLALNCQESSLLMSRMRDEPLTSVERWAVRLHHLSCATCRRLSKQFAFLEVALRRRAAQPARLSAEARQRISRAIDRKCCD